jgi:hypothetical protein
MDRRRPRTPTIACTLAVAILMMATAAPALDDGCAQVPAGLLGWWRAEGNAADFTGVNDGTLVGGVSFDTGKIGQAFSFDGTDDCVSVPNGIVSNTARQFSVTAWVRPDSVGSERRLVLDGGGTSGAHQLGMYAGKYEFKVKLTDGNWYEATAPASAEVWAFLTGVRRGTAIELWRDGELKASTTVPDLDLSAAGNGWNNARIGSSNQFTTQNIEFWDGLIDEAAIFGQALTAGEIASLAAAGSYGMCVFPQDLDRFLPLVAE